VGSEKHSTSPSRENCRDRLVENCKRGGGGFEEGGERRLRTPAGKTWQTASLGGSKSLARKRDSRQPTHGDLVLLGRRVRKRTSSFKEACLMLVSRGERGGAAPERKASMSSKRKRKGGSAKGKIFKNLSHPLRLKGFQMGKSGKRGGKEGDGKKERDVVEPILMKSTIYKACAKSL